MQWSVSLSVPRRECKKMILIFLRTSGWDKRERNWCSCARFSFIFEMKQILFPLERWENVCLQLWNFKLKILNELFCNLTFGVGILYWIFTFNTVFGPPNQNFKIHNRMKTDKWKVTFQNSQSKIMSTYYWVEDTVCRTIWSAINESLVCCRNLITFLKTEPESFEKNRGSPNLTACFGCRKKLNIGTLDEFWKIVLQF